MRSLLRIKYECRCLFVKRTCLYVRVCVFFLFIDSLTAACTHWMMRDFVCVNTMCLLLLVCCCRVSVLLGYLLSRAHGLVQHCSVHYTEVKEKKKHNNSIGLFHIERSFLLSLRSQLWINKLFKIIYVGWAREWLKVYMESVCVCVWIKCQLDYNAIRWANKKEKKISKNLHTWIDCTIRCAHVIHFMTLLIYLLSIFILNQYVHTHAA